MARCCAGPLGAVRLLDRPSWLTALPMYTNNPDVLDSRACSVSRMVAQASPRPYPSAVVARVLQRPSGASMPERANIAEVTGDSISFTPARRLHNLLSRVSVFLVSTLQSLLDFKYIITALHDIYCNLNYVSIPVLVPIPSRCLALNLHSFALRQDNRNIKSVINLKCT